MNQREAWRYGQTQGWRAADAEIYGAAAGANCDQLLAAALVRAAEGSVLIDGGRHTEGLLRMYRKGMRVGAKRRLREAGCRVGRRYWPYGAPKAR
jgi:hypothetical protein